MLEKFFAAIRNMFNVPELRRRIFFTLGLLAVYRLGAHVGAPGINKARLDEVWREVSGTLLGVLDLFSGGNFRTISVFALGVTPYITASIILQLMTVVSPQLKKLQEEGDIGRQKINQWTRYLTVGLAAIQTSFVAHWLQVNGVGAPGWGFRLSTALTLTTGTIFVMWLGEQITERGVGNGISLLIFAGIVIGLPSGVTQVVQRLSRILNAFDRPHEGERVRQAQVEVSQAGARHLLASLVGKLIAEARIKVSGHVSPMDGSIV
jgi:preprotein translocase subunit SecY